MFYSLDLGDYSLSGKPCDYISHVCILRQSEGDTNVNVFFSTKIIVQLENGIFFFTLEWPHSGK